MNVARAAGRAPLPLFDTQPRYRFKAHAARQTGGT
jgi:hypothetical protein